MKIDNPTVVMSVNAGSGLVVDFNTLTLTGASSTIQGLRLLSQGRLFVDGMLDLMALPLVQNELHGPGTVVSNGDVDLSSAILRGAVVFRNQGTANLSTGDLLFGPGGGTFQNEGSLTVASDLDIEGPNGLFINSGNLTFTGPGTLSVFSQQYVQTTGDLDIQGGEMTFHSLLIDLQGGSLNVADGATLTINSQLGGISDRRFNGLSEYFVGPQRLIPSPGHDPDWQLCLCFSQRNQ